MLEHELKNNSEHNNDEEKNFKIRVENVDPFLGEKNLDEWGVEEYLYLNKYYLNYRYGVDNLSNIEEHHLRRIMKEVLEQYKQEKELVAEGKMLEDNVILPHYEAAYRWLWELYGIKQDDIPFDKVFKDKNSGKETVFYNGELETREQEIEVMSNNKDLIPLEDRVPNDFKEYLRRLREKAHLI